MDGVLWLLASWAIVAAICYFIVGKLGRGDALPASDGGPRSENAILLGANPSAGGRSEWLNETLSWLWSNNAFSPAMTTILIRSLNDSAKKLASDESEILFEEGKTESAPVKMAPTFTEIRAAQGPKGHLSVKANMHIPSVDAKLITSQRQNGRMVVSNLEAVISDVRGEIELRLAQIPDEIYLMSCFSGRPSMNVTVVNKESHQPIDLIAAEDHIRKCILSCVVNFNLNECVPHHGPAHSYSEDYPPHQPSVSMVRYLSDAQRNEPRPRQDPRSVPNKLQISIIRAQRLGENDEAVHHPYVCIEMDEPAQKFTTQQSVNNRPYWEETFDFNLNPASDEVLFEIYDAGEDGIILDEPKFLGLAIVGLSELKQAPEPVHHLRLQGRPYKNDNVSGVLTIECRFYHDPSVPVIGKESQTVVLHQPDGSRISDKETLDRRFVYDPHDNMENFSPIPTKTTTVTVKTFKQEPTEPPTVSSLHQSQENFHAPFLSHPSPQSHSQSLTQSPPSSDWNHAENNVSPNPPDTVNFEPDGREHREQWLTPQNSTQQAEPPKPPYSPDEYPYGPPERKEQAYPDYDRLFEENAATATTESERQPRDRERRKNYGEKRDRSFFGELADRLRGRSRSKQRAKSLDEHNPVLEEAVSMPPSRDQSRTRDTITRPNQHTGSATSIPDSTAWPKDTTPSTLVLEVGRPDAPKRYYYIPPAVANDPTVISLMRRGKKLHMHNDHTFVAVKPAGRVTCNVCSKRVSGNFMKQAYQCRDCRLVSHKACHTRTRHPCPQSHVNELVIHNDVNWAEFIGKYQVGEFISEDNL